MATVLFGLALSPLEAAWELVEGNANQIGIEEETLQISGEGERNHVTLLWAGGKAPARHGAVEVAFSGNGGFQNIGVMACHSSPGSFYVARVYAGGERLLIARNHEGTEAILDTKPLNPPYVGGTWRIRLAVDGNRLEASVQEPGGGVQSLRTTDSKLPEGAFGLRTLIGRDGVTRWQECKIDDEPVPLTELSKELLARNSVKPQVAGEDLFWRDLGLTGPKLDLANSGWQIQKEKETAWKAVLVGESLLGQGFAAGVYRYKTTFETPEPWLKEDLYLLELGPISVADEVFLNGERIGGYGNFAPALPGFATSWMPRKVLIPRERFLTDQANELMVRVQVGAFGGLFRGPFTLSGVSQRATFDYALHDNAKSRLEPLLTEAAHLNQFFGKAPIAVKFRLALLAGAEEGKPVSVVGQIETSSGTILDSQAVDLESGAAAWSDWNRMDFEPGPIESGGDFVCRMIAKQNGVVLHEQVLPFRRSPARPRLDLSTLKETGMPPAEGWSESISLASVGSFGGRSVSEEGELTPDLTEVDARGTLAFTSRVSRSSNRILLFQNGVQATPAQPHPVEYYQDFAVGRVYDGFTELWPFGYIRVGDGTMEGSASLKEANWVRREYALYGKDKETPIAEWTLSKLSPAFRLTVHEKEAHLFEGLDQWELGAPSKIAFSSQGRMVTRSSGATIRGAEMGENWVLLWFHGSEGWNDFDLPWLIVFERRPAEIRLDETGLHITKSDEVGTIYGLPLNGVRLLPLSETERWASDGLPSEVVASVRQWASSLGQFRSG